MADLVSVVIPCYNQAEFLPEAIESVAAQTYRPLEIIVVDDGSTDDTRRVAAGYPDVRCLRQANRGLSAARNAGLLASTGEYVLFLDADDLLEPEALAAGVRCLDGRPECAFGVGLFRVWATDGTPTWEPAPRPNDEHPFAALLRRNWITMHGAVMYRRWVFESAGLFDISLKACEDYDLYFRIAKRFPIACHQETVAVYRRHGLNATNNMELMLRSTLQVHRRQWGYAKMTPSNRAAYWDGRRVWQRSHGDPLLRQLADGIREHRWRTSLHLAVVLARWYPSGLARVVCRRLVGRKAQYGKQVSAGPLQALALFTLTLVRVLRQSMPRR